MKKSTRNFIFLTLLSIVFSTISCTRKATEGSSRLTLQFPDASSSNVNNLTTQKNTAMSVEKTNFSFTNVPSTYSDVDCLIVFIGGPEDTMRNNYCQKSSDKSQMFKFGIFAGTLAKGQTISMEVPSGPARYIRLYGLKKPDASKSCPTIVPNSDSDFSGFSAPYFLGESKPTEMQIGANVTVEVPVTASIDSAAYFDECEGPGFGGGGGSGGGDGNNNNNKPYLRIEGFHSFNSVENPSFFRSMTRGSCYPVTFKVFKPCNASTVCEAYTLASSISVTLGSNIKFFSSELNCQNDTASLTSVSIPAGQSQTPATGNYYARVPLANVGFQTTNLQSEATLNPTTEITFEQYKYTNIQIGKPKISVSNLPSTLSFGTCASGTNTNISVYEDASSQYPINSHEIFTFEGVFLSAKALGCGAAITSILPTLSTVSVNLSKPAAASGGVVGVVKTMIFDQNINKYYLGGIITFFGGMAVNRIIRLNADGSYDPSFNVGSGFDNYVTTIVSDGMGGVYVGGVFSSYKGITVNRLAHLNSDGSLDQNFVFTFVGAEVKTLALSGNFLFVGGTFSQINGIARNNIARIDIPSRSVSSWNPNINNSVFSMVTNGTTLYVGGTFTTVDGNTRNRIAAIDIFTAIVTAWNPNANAPVAAMSLDGGSTLYVGGTFTNIGGQSRNSMAGLDTATGNANSWNPSFTGTAVNTIVWDNSTNQIYVGGVFTSIGGQARDDIARIDTSGAAASWNPMVVGASVYAIAPSSGRVALAGQFTTVRGSTSNNLASVDDSVANITTNYLNPYWGTLLFNHLLFDYTPVAISQ